MPALALALLVVLGGTALVVDRIALDNAKTELRTAAEASALAAARELANDDRLRKDFDAAALQMKARFAAQRIASENRIAGESLTLNIEPKSDVRFGRLETDAESGEPLFVEAETHDDPMTVAVNARRTTARDSAVPLPFRMLYSPTDADVVAVAEASINFAVTGLRPVDELSIPTLPLAILSQSLPEKESPKQDKGPFGNKKPMSPSKPRTQAWSHTIEQRAGSDRFRFDPATGEVTQGADGLPEITLRTASREHNPQSNAFVLTLTSDLTQAALKRTIESGWSADDLQPLGGEVQLNHGPLTVAGLRDVDANMLGHSLRNVIGQSRVVFLYDREVGDSRASVASVQVSGMVAGRVMSVRELSHCECEIVFQPAVMATRFAVTSASQSDSKCEKNKYVANLRLTN